MEQEKKNNPFGGMRQARRAVSDFLRAGRRNEARRGKRETAQEKESPWDIANRMENMSDEELENAVKTGALTPDQIRAAGEDHWDTWMGDVWSETDWPDKIAEPTYDEFMADPAKYGYERGVNADTDRAFDRYAKYGSKRK